MTRLLLDHLHPTPVTEDEAVSYVHGDGPWSRFLVTPWPVHSLLEGAAVLVVGFWAGIALSLHHLWAGTGTLLLSLVLAAVVAAPGAYTGTHREYAARYYAASRLHGDEHYRAHPLSLVLALTMVCALAGAFGGINGLHESAVSRVDWAAGGAVLGFVFGCLRVRRARRAPQA